MKKITRLSQKFKTLLLGFILITPSIYSAQTGTVWGSVKNLSELEKATTYINISEKFNINHKQALPSSKKQHLLNVYEFSCNCNEAELYTALSNISDISGLEYGPKYEPLALPDDYNMIFNPMWSLDLINAEGAWDITHGDPNLVAAVSDQNYFAVPGNVHEELLGKIVHYDPMNNSSQGHGTAVANLVAGNTNNGVGMSSIGYDIKLGLYRMNYNEVLDASNAGARVINLSWTSGCTYNQYIQDAINEVYDNGTFIVAAAGNGSTCNGPNTLVYPASFDNVFAVTSIGANDNHEKISGDPTSTHQHNNTVDLSAPGYNVPITAAPTWYLTGSGTSYASPIVVGTVGLMLSVNPCLSNLEIETFLKQSSVDIDALNPNYAGLIGAGRLNAEGAVALAANSLTNSDAFFDFNDFCEGTNNMASNIVTNGGTFSFDPLPSSGESINPITGEITGGIGGTTYTVKHVTSGLCPSYATQTVTVNALPTVWAGTDQSICNDGTTVTLSGSGATTYVWDNGVLDGISFTPTLAPPVLTTTYTVTGTDNNGCSNSDQVDVTINKLPEVLAGTDQTICNDGTTVTLNGSGATTYMWNNGVLDGVSFIPPLGTTTYTVTGSDANGCSNTDQVDVTVNDLPTVSAGTDQTICNDGTTVTLNGSGALTYVWDNGVLDGISFIPPLGTTTFTVTGTDANGCSNSDQVDVTVNDLPTVSAGTDQTICNDGTTVTLSGSGATTYSWDNGVLDGVSFMPPLGTTTYTVTETDANGCSNTDQVNVTVNDLPTVSAGTDLTICNDGTTVTLNGSGATTYMWNNGVLDGVSFIPPFGTTIYTVTGTDTNGCSNTDQVDVRIIKLPEVLAGTNLSVCNDGTAVTLNGSGAATYLWDNGVLDGVSFIPPSGTTTFTVTGTDANGCSNTDQVDVTVNDLPTVSAGTDQSICNDGTTVNLSGSGATTYSWDNGVLDGISFTPTLAPPVLTTTYTVTGTDNNGCSNTDQVDVTINKLPEVLAGTDQTICNDGTTVTLNGSGALTYVWDNGVLDGVSFIPPLGTTTYTVTGTDANGCSKTIQVGVTVNDLPTVWAGTDQSICNDGTTVSLNGSGAATYLWDNGVLDGLSFIPPFGTTTFTVTGTDANGCSNTDQVDVTINDLPTVWAGLCQTTFWGYTDDYAEVNLNGLTSGIGSLASVWTDQFGNVVGTGASTSFLTNASTVVMGDYVTSTYTLTTTDQLGCSESDEVEVTTYNVICSKPNAVQNVISKPSKRKIMVCSKGGFRCVPYNAVANVLAACQNCKLGPCDAITDCKGFAGKYSTEISFEKPVIKVYPNPSNGIINIVSQQNELMDKIEIYNHMGQLILTKHNEYNFQINLSNQSPGIYYIKAYLKGEVLSSVVSYF